MAWFRRRSATPTVDPEIDLTRPAVPPEESDAPLATSAQEAEIVPVPTPDALARTQRALTMLANQTSELHTYLVQLEHRIDVISEALLDRLDAPTHDDLHETRLHSAKVAAELSRLEVNLASRLDAVNNQLRDLRGAQADEVDLRDLTPADTGWPVPLR